MYKRLLLIIALCVLGNSAAFAGTFTCGDTISSAGTYTLSASCTCTGNNACVTVNANNVTLNLDNKTITCSPTNPTASTNATTFGVIASTLTNFTLYGADPSSLSSTGKITGCYFGLHAPYGNNYLIDRVNFSGNTYLGVNAGFSSGPVLLSRNLFNGISGYVGTDGHSGYAIAINGCGSQCTASANAILNIVTQPNATAPVVGEGDGIIVNANATSVVISYNWIENTNETPNDIGIYVATGASATVSNNSITGFYDAIAGGGTVTATDNRLLMRNASAHNNSAGISGGTGSCASNNLIVRFVTALGSTVTDCGGNITY